jgi:LysM repeat protein
MVRINSARMKKLAGSIVLLFLSFKIYAAPLDSIGVSMINSKMNIRYMVEPGETIYGLSTRYGVSVSDLLELNPELEHGLKVGQVVNIPYRPEYIKQKKADENAITHKVLPGETLYSLSKRYNTTVNELLKYNNLELKAGQEIVVGYKDKQHAQPVVKAEEPKKENPTETTSPVTEPNTTTTNTTNTNTTTTNPVAVTTPETNTPPVKEPVKETVVPTTTTVAAPAVLNYDPSKRQILVIPFDPYLYFSDADDEIAAKSKITRTKVRDVFRRRLNALLEAPGYEMIYLLGGRAKDTLSDLNKIYSSVSYAYQAAIKNPNYKAPLKPGDEVKNEQSWLEKQKSKLSNSNKDSKYEVPEDYGSYFGVRVRNPADFYAFFGNKYNVDYYVFVNQFEVKTNYENCLDRAAQNYERTFTTHFSIFDANGKQIAGNKFKTHYSSNSNYIFQIVADNVPKIADRILAELPPYTDPK